jgi:hypothetical protein
MSKLLSDSCNNTHFDAPVFENGIPDDSPFINTFITEHRHSNFAWWEYNISYSPAASKVSSPQLRLNLPFPLPKWMAMKIMSRSTAPSPK